MDPGLPCDSDPGSDARDMPQPELPKGIKKITIKSEIAATTASNFLNSGGAPILACSCAQMHAKKAPALLLSRPRPGDEVTIHYVTRDASDGSLLDSSRDRNEPFRFDLEKGMAMKGWDFALSTMRLGETAKFTIPTKFTHGGRETLLVGRPIVCEIELLKWVPRFDLFGDGAVIKSIIRRHNDWNKRKPFEGLECRFNYRCRLEEDGHEIAAHDGLLHTMCTGADCEAEADRGLPKGTLLNRALMSMKRGEVSTFVCSALTAFGENSKIPQDLLPSTRLCLEFELREFLETSDVSFEKDRTVTKKSIRSRDIWTQCLDGGHCKLKAVKLDGMDGIAVDQEQHFAFDIGSGEVCDMLECAAASLRLGEVAIFSCSTPNMFNEQQLDVAGCASVVLQLEVVGYEPGDLEDIKWDWEKIEYAKARREAASELFRAKRYRLAAHLYHKAYEVLGFVDTFRARKSMGFLGFSTEERRAKVNELKKLCMLSRALCLIKAGIYRRAIKACNYVLEDEPQNVKALFRKAQARLATGDPFRALPDAMAALRLEPQNQEIRDLIARAKAQKKDLDRTAKGMYGNMCSALGHLPHPLDVD